MKTKQIIAALAISAAVATAATTASAASAPLAPGSYTALTASRILDTRTGTGAPKAPVGAGKVLTLPLTGVPSGATAVVLNVAVVSPQTNGYLTVWPNGEKRPATSNLDFNAGQTPANLVVVPVTNGAANFFNGSGGTIQVLADLEGYYTAAQNYVAPTTVSVSLLSESQTPVTVATGGSFNANSTEVGTVDLPAGSYQITLSAKATPSESDSGQVFPQFFVYNQVKNPDFAGDLFNAGSAPLEPFNTDLAHSHDSYIPGTGVVTLDTATTLHVYAFGYDSDNGAGHYALRSLTITAVPVSIAAN